MKYQSIRPSVDTVCSYNIIISITESQLILSIINFINFISPRRQDSNGNIQSYKQEIRKNMTHNIQY